MQLTAERIAATFELVAYTRSLIDTIDPRMSVQWDQFFEKVIAKKQSLVKHIPAPLPYPEHPEAEDPDALQSRRMHNSASKALSLSLEGDFVQCFIEPTNLIQDTIDEVLANLAAHYDCNKRYDILHLKVQVFNKIRTRYAMLFRDIDPDQRLERHAEALVMECIGFCEDFKAHWMEFFASDEFFDLVDEGGFDFKQFSSIVFANAMKTTRGYHCLHGVLASHTFIQSTFKFRKFFTSLGRYILEYFLEIGRDTQSELKHLETALKQSKLLTSQIVVACVAGLRHSLQAQNRKNLKKIAYLMHVDARVVQRFWKAAVLNFDKDLSSAPSKEIRHPDRKKIADVALVERESDRRKGILVHIGNSLDRYILHKNAKGRLFVVETSRVSNRYAALNQVEAHQPETRLFRRLQSAESGGADHLLEERAHLGVCGQRAAVGTARTQEVLPESAREAAGGPHIFLEVAEGLPAELRQRVFFIGRAGDFHRAADSDRRGDFLHGHGVLRAG